MYPINDDPLAWQGTYLRRPFWIPEGGLIYEWSEHEIWAANDDFFEVQAMPVQ